MRFRAAWLVSTISFFGAIAPASAFDPEYATHPLGIVDLREFDGVAELGGHWMRVPLDWRYIEPVDDEFNWNSALTTWLDEMDARSINASCVVAIGQMWASGYPDGKGEWPSSPPVDLQTTFDPVFGYSETYYDFIFNVCTFYRDRIDRLTIENEVNTQEFWVGTMDEYRRVLATAAKAVEDAAPEILVFDSGLGSGSWGAAAAEWMHRSGDYTEDEVLAFVNEYYEYDVFAPFQFNDYQELIFWLQQPFVQHNNKHVRYILATVPPYIDGMNFKFTESHWLLPPLVDWMDAQLADFGYSVPLKINNEGSNWPRATEFDEGRNLFKLVVMSLSKGVEQTLWFPYSNETTSTPRRGLYDETGARTKQADAFENLCLRLGTEYRFTAHDSLDANVLRYRFARESDTEPTMDVMWWDDGGHGPGTQTVTYALPEGTESITRFDYDGAWTTIDVTGDSLTTQVSHIGRIYVYEQAGASTPDVPGITRASVGQNQPNPFNPRTTIEIRVQSPVRSASLIIADARGREVRSIPLADPLGAGAHTVAWDGRDGAGHALPSGTYFYRLQHVDGTSSPKRAVMIR